MPIDAAIPLQVQGPKFMTPAEGLSLQNVARQGQLQQVQLEEAQASQQKKNMLRQVMQSATDPATGRLTPQGLSAITQIDPSMGLQLGHQQEQLRLQDLAINQKKDEIKKHVGTSYVTAYDRYLQQTGGNVQQAQQLAQKDTLAAIDEMEKSGTLSQQGFDQTMVQRLKTLPPAEQMRAMVISLGGQLPDKGPTQRQERKRIVGENEVQEEFDPVSRSWREIGRGPRFAKTVQTPNAENLLLGPDERRFMAEQYMAGDRSVLQNLGRGQQGAENIIQLRREITKLAREQGASPKDVAATIGEFEGFKSAQRALGTREAQIEMAGNVTSQFAPLALEASQNFDRTKYKTLNDIEKAVLSRTASPELRRFNFANTSLINAYARAVNPSGVPTVSDKDHAREILDTGFSKGDYAAAVDQLQKEINAELKAPGAVKRGMRNFLTGKEKPEEASPAAAPSKGGWKIERIGG